MLVEVSGCGSAPCYGNSSAFVKFDGTEDIKFPVGRKVEFSCEGMFLWSHQANPVKDYHTYFVAEVAAPVNYAGTADSDLVMKFPDHCFCNVGSGCMSPDGLPYAYTAVSELDTSDWPTASDERQIEAFFAFTKYLYPKDLS